VNIVKCAQIRHGELPLEFPCDISNSAGGIALLMKPFGYLSERGHRLGLISILLGVIAVTGCDSGGNVLTPPEGGSNVDKAQPKPIKTSFRGAKGDICPGIHGFRLVIRPVRPDIPGP
jgi:hypothetical protein